MNNISWAANPENQKLPLADKRNFHIAQAAVNDHYSTHEKRADEFNKLAREQIEGYISNQDRELKHLPSAVGGTDLEKMYEQKNALMSYDSQIQSQVLELHKIFKNMGITLKQYDTKCRNLYEKGLDYVKLQVNNALAENPDISAADLKLVKEDAIEFYKQNFARARTELDSEMDPLVAKANTMVWPKGPDVPLDGLTSEQAGRFKTISEELKPHLGGPAHSLHAGSGSGSDAAHGGEDDASNTASDAASGASDTEGSEGSPPPPGRNSIIQSCYARSSGGIRVPTSGSRVLRRSRLHRLSLGYHARGAVFYSW